MKESLILAVDDNASNLTVIKTILEKSDYSFLTAGSGAEALKTAEIAQPDMILLDDKMPDMDGFETLHRLKASETTAHIPVIILTADTEAKSMVKGFEAGAADCITKPFKSIELRSRMKTHLNLAEKTKIIDKKNSEHKELIHILCHDLSNPLNNMQRILEMFDDDPSMLDSLVDPMRISIRNSLELIDLIRGLRTFDEKKESLQLITENLHDVIMEAVCIIEQQARKKQIELDIDIEKQHLVRIEKTSFINSVFNNLLTNAIKFSFPNSRIELKSSRRGNTVELTIRDHGIGMPPQMIDDMFDISKKTNRQGTHEEQGTGYGMPLVKKFMTAYGGAINVKSAEKTDNNTDHGTEIILTFGGDA